MPKRADLHAYPPRGMDRLDSARYIGVSATKFDLMVADRRMPKPKKIDGRMVWDRVELDMHFTDLPARDEGGNRIDALLARAAH